MSANDQAIVAVTGRAHCQRQVAFFVRVLVYQVSLNFVVERHGLNKGGKIAQIVNTKTSSQVSRDPTWAMCILR